MARGKIKLIRLEKGDGFIVPDGSDPNDRDTTVYFRLDRLTPRGAVAPIGATVEFESERTDKGWRARTVRLLEATPHGGQAHGDQPAHQPPGPAAQAQPPQPQNNPGDTHFLNPYNFVRPLAKRRPDGHVLGNCPPPPHDRYVGLNGRITCEVEAVTPLFISDSHAVVRADGGHATYRFFQVGGQPALPATSLRGMVRSVYEAVTNSCFAVFQRDDETKDGTGDRLEYRISRDPGLKPAIVRTLDTSGAKLEVLDCARTITFTVNPHPTLMRSGYIPAYSPRVLRTDAHGVSHAFTSTTTIAPGLDDGARVAALVSTQPQVKGNRYQWFRVDQVVAGAAHAILRAAPNQRLVFGYLHRTGPNIENKHDERLFFRWDDLDLVPRKTYKDPQDIYVKADAVHAYNRMLKHYWDRHQDTVEDLAGRGWPTNANSLPHPSNFIRKDRRLEVGDLVYYFVEEDGRQRLCPVSMPRLAYKNPREALLPKQLWPCTDWDRLCPACRTFGWVHADAENLAPGIRTAYAGRVRFSHGVLQGTAERLPSTRLAILSSPKPTTTAFYLLGADGKPGKMTYDTPDARLRGRKVYRHHGERAQSSEYIGQAETDQNRTVRDALAPGAKFNFDLDFENLAPLELGALLWSLELEQGMHHRLGFAKPLGFGSVRMRVTKLEILLPAERYASLDANTGRQIVERATGKPWSWVGQFKSSLATYYAGNSTDFSKLEPVHDLRVLHSNPTFGRIHYPRATRNPTAEGENFKWFVGNKRNLNNNHGGQWLHLPEEERTAAGALRLVNARGDDV